MAKSRQQAEYGDFQTPRDLAVQVCDLLIARGVTPNSVVEPTCGLGSLLLAALEKFPSIQRAHALEINNDYLVQLQADVGHAGYREKVSLNHADFFATDWPSLFNSLPEPLLVIGNPPWVTNSELGRLESENLPRKTNFQNHLGLDAITGKSNFDVSEWMLNRLLELLDGRYAILAILCKTTVARKVLTSAWRGEFQILETAVYGFDASKHFGAAVDACLLFCELKPSHRSHSTNVYDDIKAHINVGAWGLRNNELIADVHAYDEAGHLRSDNGKDAFIWRSGVKHDCSKVMELRRDGLVWVNKAGESIDLESKYLFPMLKSSDLANGRTAEPSKWMLVTQRSVGEDTTQLKRKWPFPDSISV